MKQITIPVIRVGNVVCRIDGPRAIVQEIDRKTAVSVPDAHFAMKHAPGWDGKWHPVNVLQKTFSTGLLPRVRRVVPVARVIDERKKPKQLEINPDILNGIVFSEFQLAGIIGILEEGRGTIGIGVGGGKTECGIGIAMHVPGKCVYIVHRKDALQQTVERIEQRTGEFAARIGDGVWDDRAGDDLTKFVVAMPQTIIRDPNLFRMQVADANVIILDEVHVTGSAKTWYALAQSCPAYYRAGLTGTPKTGDPVKDMRLEAAAGPILIRIKASELAAAGLLVPCKVIVHKVDNLVFVSKNWGQVRRTLIEENEARNNKIIEITIAAVKKGARVLIICDTKRHERRLSGILQDTGIRCAILHGGHSTGARTAAKRDLRAGILEAVLATPIWDDSIDLPELDTVILAAGGKSGVRVVQRIGRALRVSKGKTHATVHDFHDTGNSYVVRHSVARQRACKREGFEMVRAEMTNA